MTAKIFYRERGKITEGEKKPRFKLVAVSGVSIDFFAEHLRKKELELIAKEVGAELVFLANEADGDQNSDEEIKVR